MRWLLDLFFGEDPIHHDRARRFLIIAEDAVREHHKTLKHDVLKRVVTSVIQSGFGLPEDDERALARAIWTHTNSVYPGLLDIPEPSMTNDSASQPTHA